jgi:D-alanine-D-alanine ligase
MTIGAGTRIVAVVFGGISGEHEVSLVSAKSVWDSLDRARYVTVPVAITKGGLWLPPDVSLKGLERGTLEGLTTRKLVTPMMGKRCLLVVDRVAPPTEVPIDVAFPVLHGPGGEDGTVQGLLELMGVPYVGAGVAASGVGMDKALMKALFIQSGLPVCKHRVLFQHEWEAGRKQVREDVLAHVGIPCFVKPANLGSSVGISKVKTAGDFGKALETGFSYDRKVVIEEAVEGREVECSVLGNDHPEASLPGEIVPCEEFYSYAAKYENPSELRIPAQLPADVVRRIQELAIRAFQSIDCRGMARVDFFLKTDGGILVNEINTIPGFTAISMYPKLWEASGLPYTQLLDRLIELALEAGTRLAWAREQGGTGARELGHR